MELDTIGLFVGLPSLALLASLYSPTPSSPPPSGLRWREGGGPVCPAPPRRCLVASRAAFEWNDEDVIVNVWLTLEAVICSCVTSS
ncbi:unnamed protein product [Protopolystoma xenopodis]|uniref:Secreted protein n=1 Tax=Protopolystoma xenopodis TaxID=117903 RepID=A0A448XQ06_9PLAT|nr:unnamed protein product [Protopolystoma xenopodis]